MKGEHDMKKQIIAALFCAAILVSACAGCAKSEPEAAPADAPAVMAAHEEPKTAPPADGWTMAKLLEVSTINGAPLSVPITVKSLGDGMELSTEDYTYSKEGKLIASLNRNGTFFCSVGMETEDVNAADENTPIIFLDLHENDIPAGDVRINGLTFGSSKEEVTAALGEPTDPAVQRGTRAL